MAGSEAFGMTETDISTLDQRPRALGHPRGSRWGDPLLAGAAGAYVLLVCALPMLRLFAEGLAQPDAALAMLGGRATLRALQNTLVSGLGSTLVSVVVGGGLALAIGLTDIRRRGVLALLCLLPMLIPPQIAALAWIRLLDAGTPARALLDAVTGRWPNHPLYSGGGVVWIMGLEHAALVFLAVTAAIRSLPCDLVEAARAAGARGSRILLGILLPLLRPAFVAGAALAFVSAIGNFGVPALLGIPGRYSVLTTLIYQRLSGFGPSVLGEVAALALVLAVLAALGLGLQRWAAARAPVLVRTGPTGPVLPLGRARPWVEAALWLVVGVLSVAPLLALLASALVPALGVDLTFDTISLDQFGYILFQHDATRRAFLNSALLAGAAALATAAVGLVLAYYAEARRWRAMRWLDTLADLPYALPGVLTAIAAILLLLRPLPLLGVSLYGTLWIILAAYLGRFLALALRPVAAAIAQADPAPEEAARLAGARGPRRLCGILLPAVAPAVATGAILVFLTAFNELTVSALLWSRGSETVGVMVFSLQAEGAATAASAVAVLTVLVTLGLAGIATLFARRLPKGSLPWLP
jgi:iron(III) transport system permease protein